MKGILALDIDGTLTSKKEGVFDRVVQYLGELSEKGWIIFFITGRNYHRAMVSLRNVSFPFIFGMQNGALILEMPSHKLIAKRYLDHSIFQRLDEIFENEETDGVIYSGWDNQDVCYFRPDHFSRQALEYVENRSRRLEENWIPITTYSDVPIETFASVKCFGNKDSALRIQNQVRLDLGLSIPINRDPYQWDHFVLQATHREVNKGAALERLVNTIEPGAPVIAAGDDENDLEMLRFADVAIVMESAPEEILAEADLIAPSSESGGIIHGIDEAVKILEG